MIVAPDDIFELEEIIDVFRKKQSIKLDFRTFKQKNKKLLLPTNWK